MKTGSIHRYSTFDDQQSQIVFESEAEIGIIIASLLDFCDRYPANQMAENITSHIIDSIGVEEKHYPWGWNPLAKFPTEVDAWHEFQRQWKEDNPGEGFENISEWLTNFWICKGYFSLGFLFAIRALRLADPPYSEEAAPASLTDKARGEA